MSVIKKNIIASLAYFDVFNYPLTQAEIFLFMPVRCDADSFNSALSYLLLHDCVYRFDSFYTLKNDPEIAQRRIVGNKKAAELIRVAERVGSLLIKFPYVRAIAISGSLSKNFAEDHSDIDLFVITAPNRLWIARTLMHLFKKLTFLVKKEHFFCMNYYIDEQELQIMEKNIYTATEVVTLIPLEGDTVFEKFYPANAWTLAYLPNNYMRVSTAKPFKRYPLKSLMEYLLNSNAGNIIDNLLQRMTTARWDKKARQKKLNANGVVMAMDAGKHYAKPEANNYQQRLIMRYENRLREVLPDHEKTLAPV